MKIFSNKKVLYILILGIICILPFVLSNTYAKFIGTYVTEDDVVKMDLSFDISIDGIDEYHEVEVASGEFLKFNVQVENNSSSTVYYGVWYKMISPVEMPDDDSIEIGVLDGTTGTSSGQIIGGGSTSVTLGIFNGSEKSIVVYVGIASSDTSVSDIEYLNGKNLITGTVILKRLSSFVADLYNDGSSLIYANIGSSASNPSVSLNVARSVMLDNNGEYRYYGNNPDNYVWYNDELWRIISVSNVKSSMDDVDGELRVKLIKATALVDDNEIGEYSWDSSDSLVADGVGIGDWSRADIMNELNNFYYNGLSGACYVGRNNATAPCSFANLGLSSKARNLIDDAVYYIGSPNEGLELYADDFYTGEREKSWGGKVGLMYSSDFAYATDLSICTEDVYNYDIDCSNNNWLGYDGDNNWTMTKVNNFDTAYVTGSNLISDSEPFTLWKIRPVLYLKSTVVVVGGTGTSTDPYIIGNDKTATGYYAYQNGMANVEMGITAPIITASLENLEQFVTQPYVSNYKNAVCTRAEVNSLQNNNEIIYVMKTPNLSVNGMSNVRIDCIEGYDSYISGDSTGTLKVYGISSSGISTKIYDGLMRTGDEENPTSVVLDVLGYDYINVEVGRSTVESDAQLSAIIYDGIQNIKFY